MEAKLIEGNISKTLLNLAIPTLFANLAIILYHLINSYFVGRLGVHELAAISFTFPVIMIMNSAASALALGVSSVIAIALGEGKQRQAKAYASNSLILAIITSIILMFVGLTTIEPLFKLLGATEETLKLITSYVQITYSGSLFLFLPYVAGSILKATGDSKTPSIVLIISLVLNFILDPLLIFGIGIFPRLEIQGAAVATLIAGIFRFCSLFYILIFKKKYVSLDITEIKMFFKESWKEILILSIPAFITFVMYPISNAFGVYVISPFGNEAVAGFGLGNMISGILLISIVAFSSSLPPIIGQNLGAGKFSRVRDTLKVSGYMILGVGTFGYIVYLIFAEIIANTFTKDQEVISYIIYYLWLIPISYGNRGIFLSVNAFFNSIKKPGIATLLSVCQVILIYMPLTYTGSKLFGVIGIYIGIAVSNLVSSIISLYCGRTMLSKIESRCTDVENCKIAYEEI